MSHEIPNADTRQEGVRRALLVEDNPDDAFLIREHLAEARTIQVEHVESLGKAIECVSDRTFDVIMLDLSLPDSHGLETFASMYSAAPQTPIVVLTGLDDETLALKALNEGAQDYLVKSHVDGQTLIRSMRYAVERKRIRAEIEALNATLEKRVEERTEELARAYDALARANQELLEVDRMKSAFFASTSHELRTPLTVINGMMTLIDKRMGDAPPEIRRMLRAAMRVGDRLENITLRALDFSYTGDMSERLQRHRSRVQDLIDYSIAEISPFIEIRGHRLETHVPDDLPEIDVDADKIQDVLINLLMNAVRFTPDGGSIELNVKRLDDDKIQFDVIDSGIGIRDEDKPHIFKEFFSTMDVEHHSSGEYEFGSRGIGLGLAIVKRFVEMHGGQVGVESQPDRGSRFYFTLPQAAPQRASNEESAA